MLNLWEVFGAEIPRANACGVAIEVNKLRVAEARHTDPDELYSNSIVLLSMVLLEPGHKVCVHSSNNRNSLAPAKQKNQTEVKQNAELGEDDAKAMSFAGAMVQEVSEDAIKYLRRASI
ncbi:unnamed protein product [Oikopleura dioica]|uniref:Uncharacterized protein n=1 Tax=Oikopleura dioica TaxID=34765 RepID=E4XLP1_OIKDI|nr:unnamed protein product [Oikopleura dioica]